jgi:hypothetical protein
MSEAFVPSSCVADVHTRGVSELMHPAHAIKSNINPLKQSNM